MVDLQGVLHGMGREIHCGTSFVHGREGSKSDLHARLIGIFHAPPSSVTPLELSIKGVKGIMYQRSPEAKPAQHLSKKIILLRVSCSRFLDLSNAALSSI